MRKSQRRSKGLFRREAPLLWGSVAVLALALVFSLGFLRTATCNPLQFNQTAPLQVAPESPAAALESAFTQVATAVSPAVVNISAEWTERVQTMQPNFNDMQDFFNWFYGNSRGMVPREYKSEKKSLGSGFIITSDGYILTNGHVVGKAEKITVFLQNGRTLRAQVVGRDEKTDIALLKVDAGKSLPSVPLADSDRIQVGQWAVAIGNPFGLDHTLTTGVISAKGRSVNLNENSPYASYIQTDASINPGNSGGPLCNLKGEVIGINTAIYSQTGTNVGIGFAIPSNVARKVAADLALQGRVARAGLGANVQPLDEKMAKSFGLADAQGALINNVGAGSAAEKAGLRPGDVIVGMDGEDVTGPSDLIAKLYTKSPGDRVRLRLMRDKGETELTAVLQPLEDAVPVVSRRVAPTKAEEKAKANVGLTFQDMTPDLKAQLDPSAPQGPVLLAVKKGGVAEAAGLRAGDIVLQAGDRKIQNAETLNQILQTADLKKGLRLFIWRDGVTMYCLLQTGR